VDLEDIERYVAEGRDDVDVKSDFWLSHCASSLKLCFEWEKKYSRDVLHVDYKVVELTFIGLTAYSR
jgi:hypothetical protein